MKTRLILLLLALCSYSHAQEFTDLYGDYLGQVPPGETPMVFAPGVVSTRENNEHWAPTFSPDGNEVFWFANRRPGPSNSEWLELSWTMRREDGRWTKPQASPFDGMFAYSSDGRRGYFASEDDMWVVEKQGAHWGIPQCLNITVRFPELKPLYMPSVTNAGTLYFIGTIPGTQSDVGIYRAEWIEDQYAQPELLPSCINRPGSMNWAPFIAPDESYLLFSSGRPGSLDRYGDLYISLHLADGSWADPVSLGAPINTNRQEVFPGLSPDGKYFFFARDIAGRENDIYWVEAEPYLPDPNGPVLNQSQGIRYATLQAAVRLAQPGDEIVIEPGIYQENLTINGKDIILRSSDPNDPYYIGGTIIQGHPNEPIVSLVNTTTACTLAGLTLRTGFIGLSGTATNATLRNCRIMENTEHGMLLSQESRPYLHHCLITANGQAGITMLPTTGGRSIRYCQPLIVDCIIVQNGQTALEGGEPIVINSIIQD